MFKDGDHVVGGFEPQLVPVIRSMLASAGVATFEGNGAYRSANTVAVPPPAA